MTVPITTHYVTVGTRRVRYTRAGSGPAVCLFHPSPCSALRMRATQAVFAARFTALAFDTPGFGHSDKLPLAQPEIADFADAFAETLTALGIGRCAVHGNHTGAAIAVEFAARHPSRCAMALADGYPAYSGGQAADRLKRYLEPLVPTWDGGHLLWLWYRYREQHVFWPWHDHDLAHRADTDVPDADFLHQGVIDLLEAGDDYRIGYAAAFRGRGLGVLADLTVPVCFTLRPGDSLYRTRPAYEGTDAWVEETPRDPHQAALRERALLERHPGDVPPPPPACAAIPGRLTTDFVALPDGGALFLRSGGDIPPGGAASPPLLCLHPLPGSSALLTPLLTALATTRTVLAPDVPGHGESPPCAPGPGADFWAPRLRAVLALLDARGIAHCDVLADGSAAPLAAALVAHQPGRVRRWVLDAPSLPSDEVRAALVAHPAPSAIPEMDGTHLLRVWHHLRDQELWQPWFERRRENIRRVAPQIAPEALTLRAREMLKQPGGYAATHLAVASYPLAQRLAGLRVPPTLLLVRDGDGDGAGASALAALLPEAAIATGVADPAAQAARIAAFLDS
jgi:pimeloyl-ACP methyl ester carboxylesterase